jgi:hypothetical protein
MSAVVYEKLNSDVTMKVTYTGTDVKLDIKDIKASAVVAVAGTAKNRTTKDEGPGDLSGKPEKLKPEDLPSTPDKVPKVFLAIKLAPNQKLGYPVMFSVANFNPKECNNDKVLQLTGDATVAFWVAKDDKESTKDFGVVAVNNALPPDGLVWFYNPNDQEVYLDIYLGYGPTPPK